MRQQTRPGAVVRVVDLFDTAAAVLCPCGQDIMAVESATPIPDGVHGTGGIDRECRCCGLLLRIEVQM